ncbi:MAG: glycosyl hydrolase, partial [Casimicrobiaceae bacterium]
TPDGPKVHSIVVDPRDASHLYMSMSGGGTFESTDRGADWKPLNKGVLAIFFPDPYPEFGQDPHCVRMHPQMPDRLYQQNHCGIFRLDRPSDTWIDIGKGMPKKVGNIGFPITLHPRDPDTAWVFPMDGSDVWPRTSPGGTPAVFRTTNGGQTWKRQDKGFPAAQAWWTVKRQAMTADGLDALGLYFGTTSGEIWASKNEGESWKCLTSHLPHIYALEAAAFR